MLEFRLRFLPDPLDLLHTLPRVNRENGGLMLMKTPNLLRVSIAMLVLLALMMTSGCGGSNSSGNGSGGSGSGSGGSGSGGGGGGGGNPSESVLHTFTGNSDGGLPANNLVRDAAGNLYGVAGGGNPTCFQGLGCGVVFELTPQSNGGWTESVLYTFQGGADGSGPEAGLLIDKAGNLYGVTGFGGVISGCPDNDGCGTVFQLKPSGNGVWTKTTLYSFAGGADGEGPNGPLIFDQMGNLYGVTIYGGGVFGPACGSASCGTVFELSPNSGGGWTETVISAFGNAGNNSTYPVGSLLLLDGNLYGVTEQGGAAAGGTAFGLGRLNGLWTRSLISSLDWGPEAGLISDDKGNLYGTTSGGGTGNCPQSQGCGTVFQLSLGTGTLTTLYDFAGGTDGANPVGLTLFKSHLYGITSSGGNTGCVGRGCGTVFELSPQGLAWQETVLHRFADGKDGANPLSGALLVDDQGNIYGTTNNGGPSEEGVVFEITP